MEVTGGGPDSPHGQQHDHDHDEHGHQHGGRGGRPAPVSAGGPTTLTSVDPSFLDAAETALRGVVVAEAITVEAEHALIHAVPRPTTATVHADITTDGPPELPRTPRPPHGALITGSLRPSATRGWCRSAPEQLPASIVRASTPATMQIDRDVLTTPPCCLANFYKP